MTSSTSSPCAACKFLRRKCVMGCVFSPFFPQEDSAKFISVHRAFGASNVAKLLTDLTPAARQEAVISLCFEADLHLQDPVVGCAGYIQRLQNRLQDLNDQTIHVQSEIAKIMNSPGVDFLPHNLQNFSSLPWGMQQDIMYSPQLQMLDQSLESQQIDGLRYSGSESGAGPATVLALAPQQTDNSARQNHFLHDRRQQ